MGEPVMDAIARGEKREEYRVATPHWRRRLEDRQFAGIVLKKGYPKRGDSSRMLARAMGFIIRAITHPHFGTEPVVVFSIIVN